MHSLYNELQITALVERECKVYYPEAYSITPSLSKSVWGYGCFLTYLSDILFNSHNHFLNYLLHFVYNFIYIIAQLKNSLKFVCRSTKCPNSQ